MLLSYQWFATQLTNVSGISKTNIRFYGTIYFCHYSLKFISLTDTNMHSMKKGLELNVGVTLRRHTKHPPTNICRKDGKSEESLLNTAMAFIGSQSFFDM